MSKLYVLAGRPGSGKTEYLNRIKNEVEHTVNVVSALDFSSHEDLVRELYEIVQNDRCQCIAIDDYEVMLIKLWGERILDNEYRKCLSILAGFSDSFDVNVIVVVGLKREADKDNHDYYDRKNLRSAVISEEADEVFFIKRGSQNELTKLNGLLNAKTTAKQGHFCD